jgi:Amt family ammonium transporter
VVRWFVQRRQRARRHRLGGTRATTTPLAPAGTLVVWTILDMMRQKRSTAFRSATAIVVGLVAITPAADL